LKRTGFEILDLLPSEDALGLWHIFNNKNKIGNIIWAKDFITFEYDWRGKILLRLAKSFPFFMSHFQVAICKKPLI
jgi:ABC-type molybdate transport system permease subunit